MRRLREVRREEILIGETPVTRWTAKRRDDEAVQIDLVARKGEGQAALVCVSRRADRCRRMEALLHVESGTRAVSLAPAYGLTQGIERAIRALARHRRTKAPQLRAGSMRARAAAAASLEAGHVRAATALGRLGADGRERAVVRRLRATLRAQAAAYAELAAVLRRGERRRFEQARRTLARADGRLIGAVRSLPDALGLTREGS